MGQSAADRFRQYSRKQTERYAVRQPHTEHVRPDGLTDDAPRHHIL